MARRGGAAVWMLAVLMGLLTACGGSQSAEKPVLTVSIPPQKYLVEQIAGPDYTVNSLLTPGSNPETFDPSINHLTGLQHSKAYFRLGTIGFEQATLDKISDNFPDLKIVNTSTSIPILRGTHGPHRGHGHHKEAPDPHLWVSVRNARTMARNIYEAMCELDPGRQELFAKNYQQLDARLAAVDDSIKMILDTIPGAVFAIWHPSLSYFANDYGLHQLAVEAHGKEATPKEMRQRLDEARALKPRVFLYEREHDPSQSMQVGQDLGIPMAPVSLMDYEIYENMTSLAHEIAR